MKKRLGLLLAVILMGLAAQAAAQERMRVYISEEAMSRRTAQMCMDLLEDAFPQAQWEPVWSSEASLRDRVMADDAPQMAICAPEEARAWAKEGILVPMEGRVTQIGRMPSAVVDACVYEESLFMAPLLARHRRIAVNRDLMREENMDYMMNETEHPVWFPTELYQVMDVFAVQDRIAFDLWKPDPSNIGGIEAFVQALYGGALLSDDATICLADDAAVRASVVWLRDMLAAGMVGYVSDRETALERFLHEETPIFLDWTDAEAREYVRPGFELVTMQYPSSCGLPVRSFGVTGIAVFAGKDEALALSAAAYLMDDERAQATLGERAVYADESIWLPCIASAEAGATLRSGFCSALTAIVEKGALPEEELGELAAAVNLMTETKMRK